MCEEKDGIHTHNGAYILIHTYIHTSIQTYMLIYLRTYTHIRKLGHCILYLERVSKVGKEERKENESRRKLGWEEGKYGEEEEKEKRGVGI